MIRCVEEVLLCERGPLLCWGLQPFCCSHIAVNVLCWWRLRSFSQLWLFSLVAGVVATVHTTRITGLICSKIDARRKATFWCSFINKVFLSASSRTQASVYGSCEISSVFACFLLSGGKSSLLWFCLTESGSVFLLRCLYFWRISYFAIF